MPVTLTNDEYDAVVARLRAAGCVFAEAEAGLLVAEAIDRRQLTGMVERRVTGEPLETILGWVEFCGLRIGVSPGVFVPRRRTEFLVEHAARRLTARDAVLDLCCGCGAIGMALVARLPGIELHAVELDPVAASCARRNLDAAATVYVGDLFAPLPAAMHHQFAVIAANVPYVPTDDIATMPPEAREHEPAAALDGGPDGLDLVRAVAATAPIWLAPGGALLIETSIFQADHAAEILDFAGLTPAVLHDGALGATVVAGIPRA